jgi:hypothetical protein
MEFSEGTGSLQLLDPASLDASIYNNCLAILTRHPEAFEDTCVSDALSGFRFAPAIKIIGRTIGKIFNRLYTGPRRPLDATAMQPCIAIPFKVDSYERSSDCGN